MPEGEPDTIERDIPQSWLLSYADECLEISKKFEKGSVAERAALQRAQYALDIVQVWRTEPDALPPSPETPR
jgi:hypothetical protein